MEEDFEKTFYLLEKWMELKKIPKKEQIKYYQELISVFEKKDDLMKQKIMCFTTGGMALSSSITCYLLGNDSLDYIIATFLLFCSALIGTIPLKNETPTISEEYKEIEKQRVYIKNLCEKRKD